MKAWLGSNRDQFEFYLLHAMLHDSSRRAALLSVPLVPDDFGSDEYALIMAAVALAVNIAGITNVPLPSPPNLVFMLDYLKPAASNEEADDTTVAIAKKRLVELMDPSFSAQWYSIDAFLEPWLTTARGKRYARKIQSSPVADMAGVAELIQRDMAAARIAVGGDAVDSMDDAMDGTEMDREPRKSTGIPGLDICLNGGWGVGECYLVFSGTGGGKSICAGQCAWTELVTGGAPLIVSTELKACEYIARMISNACSIKITHLQDCANFLQIKMAVASRPELAFHLHRVEEAQKMIRKSLRVAKVRSDDGLNARAVLERELLEYKKRYGREPTWICLDWLGSIADVSSGKTSSERAMAWEISATSCVKFAEDTGIPTLVLAQAVNDAQTRKLLTLADIGISKGIGKNMVAVIGITNSVDKEAVQAALLGKADMPKSATLEDQLFCVCKARKGEGNNVQVVRDFGYQRFNAKPKGS